MSLVFIHFLLLFSLLGFIFFSPFFFPYCHISFVFIFLCLHFPQCPSPCIFVISLPTVSQLLSFHLEVSHYRRMIIFLHVTEKLSSVSRIMSFIQIDILMEQIDDLIFWCVTQFVIAAVVKKMINYILTNQVNARLLLQRYMKLQLRIGWCKYNGTSCYCQHVSFFALLWWL